tara:strand:- start:166 stop:792 length:627 start_codon:yes stop_codon:yes gene_type:complete
MRKIKCINCGVTEVFSAKEKRCTHCNCKLYGYNINTLPEVYKNILSSSSSTINQPKKPSSFNPSSNKVGWFVTHTEGKKQEVFKLKEGVNYIGRLADGNKPDIVVSGDEYVSRGHAHIMVQNINGEYEYTIFDNSNNQTGSASLNGTYINGDSSRLNGNSSGKKIMDGYTIQIGETKLVIKTPRTAKDDTHAKTIVSKMDFTRTIVIN